MKISLTILFISIICFANSFDQKKYTLYNLNSNSVDDIIEAISLV